MSIYKAKQMPVINMIRDELLEVLFGQLLVPVVVYEEIIMPNTPHTLHVYLTIYGTSFVQWNTAFYLSGYRS